MAPQPKTLATSAYLSILTASYIVSGQSNNQLDELRRRGAIPFNETLLPESQRDGQFVEHLGHILSLGNSWSGAPKRADPYTIKITLFNRRQSSQTDIVFRPNNEKGCFPQLSTCVQYDLDAIASSGFDASLRTVMMISGYLTDDHVYWMERTKDLWLELDDVNVILITWSGANRYLYSTAVADTPVVSRQITILLHYLAQLSGFQLLSDDKIGRKFTSNIHFVGHSLGAHIAGFVGQDLGSGRLGRITALDPAGPSFDMMPASRRLDASDAQLVDVFHTNAGKMHYAHALAAIVAQAGDMIVRRVPILSGLSRTLSRSTGFGQLGGWLLASGLTADGRYEATVEATDGSGEGNEASSAWYGLEAPCGHLDYYANGGRVQPGCVGLMHTCDHARSHEIYEAVLKREVALSRRRRSAFRDHSLLAFRSRPEDDESFSAGSSLDRNCYLRLAAGRNSSKPEVARLLKEQCFGPLDFLSWPVSEFKRRLRETYSIDLDSSAQNTSALNNRFYFQTRAQRPLLDDHSLLKIRLRKPGPKWTETPAKCALRLELQMANGKSRTLRLSQRLNLPLIDEKHDNRTLIALPFITMSYKGEEEEDQPLAERIGHLIGSLESANDTSRGESLEFLRRILPVEVKMTATTAASSTWLGSATTKIAGLVNWLSWGMAGRYLNDCKLEVGSIEICPLIRAGQRAQLVALYGYKPENTNSTLNIVHLNEAANLSRRHEASDEIPLQLALDSKGKTRRLSALLVMK